MFINNYNIFCLTSCHSIYKYHLYYFPSSALFHSHSAYNSYLYINTQCQSRSLCCKLSRIGCIANMFCPLILSLIVPLLSLKMQTIILYSCYSNWILTQLTLLVKRKFQKTEVFLNFFYYYILHSSLNYINVFISFNIFNLI